MEAKHYKNDGTQKGTVELPEALFNVPVNHDLIHQVVTVLEANRRTPVAHTKDRSEVSGGGRKPWRQKGTGNARHGSIRSPIWRGGGTTFGPRKERAYEKQVPRRMRSRALFSALSEKFRRGEVLFADAPEIGEPKTATARSYLKALADTVGATDMPAHPNRSVCIVVPEHSETLLKSFRNIGTTCVIPANELTAREVVHFRYVVILDPESTIPVLARRAESAKMSTAQQHAA